MITPSQAATGARTQLEAVTVLLVDDDERWAWATGRLLERDGPFTVEFAHSLAAGRERFRDLDPDCVVCDYDLGDGDGLELLEVVRDADPDRPFVLITGKGDEGVASEAIGRGVTDYVRKGADDAGEVLASKVATAVHTYRTERALERQRRSKTAVLDVLRGTTSEGDLCRQFPRRLVEEDAYAMAWIGTAAAGGDLRPRASAGRDDYLDEVVDGGDLPGTEPCRRALEDEGTVVETDLARGGPSEAWATVASGHGFESVIATPVQYEGVVAGVLGVYLSASSAADAREARLVEEYAGSVGYAFKSLDRKRTLLSDRGVRVEVAVADPAIPLLALAERLPTASRIECPSVVDRTDEATVYLCHVEGCPPDVVPAGGEDVTGVTVADVERSGSTVRCAVLVEGVTPEAVLGAHGARFERTVVDGGVATVTVRAGEDRPVSRLRAALERDFSDVSVRTVWTDDGGDGIRTHPFEDLTDKQREYLRHAFHEGYFERPRGATGTEIADRLGIARQTLTQHLRAGERKVLDRLLEERRSG